MSCRAIIVGGGISGIAAAQRLIQNGITDIVLLEAKERLGGRIITEKYGTSHLDLGAQWIHGEGGPILDIAKEQDFIHDSGDDETEDFFERNQLFYTQSGQRISEKLAANACRTMSTILSDADRFFRDDTRMSPEYAKHDSIGKYLREEFDKLSVSSSTEDKEKEQAILEWRMLFENSDNGCQSLDDVSLYGWGQYIEYGGNQDVVLKYGFQPIFDVLLRDIPQKIIRTNAEVEKIDWSKFQGQEVDRSNKTGPKEVEVTLVSGETLRAEYVIFTCSLGVLQAKASDIFVPNLGKEKTDVIAKMGFGIVDKIFMDFEQPFWQENCDGINLTWTPEREPFRLKCLDDAHLKKYGEWYRAISTFETVDFHPGVLLGWVAGEEAVTMEALDEDTVSNVCHELLRRFTGLDVPKPVKILRSRWRSDPHILGSYSYTKSGQTLEDFDSLAKPLPSEQDAHLLFAGEATDRDHFSTTNGAVLAGRREADRIVQAIHTQGYVDH